MLISRGLKATFLAGLVVIGIAARCLPARAQESAALTVAGGCFWCVEADFERVPGVIAAISGYAGGTVQNPTYAQVTRGGTGHFEAVQIRYDPARITRAQLLHMFLRSIDPTDPGGQFCDRGPSYRTAIFAADATARAEAEAALTEAATALGREIATEILPAAPFYPAEPYHQDYYKGTRIVLTRAGPKRQAKAYKFYRKACGRDARVRELWGAAAPFAGG